MSSVVTSAPAAASASGPGSGSGSGASAPVSATGATVSGFVGKEEPEVTTVAGRLTEKNNEDSYVGGWKDGAGPDAEFCFPNGLALGKDKQLFVSDSDNRRIRKIDLKTGAVSTFAGGGGFGYLETRAYPFADSHADLARFGEVRGICIDAKDNLYVADMFHYRIRKVTPEAEVSTFAGQAKVPKPAAQPTPEGSVATAANGVANGTDAHGKPANGANGAAQPTQTQQTPPPDPNEQYADGPATSGAKFNRPSAVAVDKANNVYVCDFSNNRIRKVSPDGNVTTHAGSGEKGYKDGPGKEAAFNWPNHIAIDRHNNLYVAEAENFRIRKVSPTGLVSTYAGSGTAGFADGPADRAKFDGPNAVAVDHDGFVYVTEDENHRVRLISPNGVVRTLAGNGDRGESNGTSAATAQFAMPTGLTIDPDTGHLYVCDYGNHLIRKVHQRAIAALKAAMLKETDGRFPPMPQIDEEDDKTNDADNTDPVSTNSQSGANTTDASDAEGSANGKHKKKKSSKSKKREKTENGVAEEGKATDKEESTNGSASASRKSSASANGAEGAAGKEGEKPADAEDPAKAAAAAGQEDADNKSCRMCQSKNGCEIM